MDDDALLLGRALGLGGKRSRVLAGALGALGGLPGLFRAGSGALERVLPRAALERLDAILALASAAVGPTRPPPEVIDSAEDLIRYLGSGVVLLPSETFFVLMLDARGRPLGVERIAIGTLTACLVHPREVFAPAIRARAASVLVAHNHPSGDPEPSPEDLHLTERLAEAGQILGIPLVDHVVLAARGFRSLGGGLPARPYMARAGGK